LKRSSGKVVKRMFGQSALVAYFSGEVAGAVVEYNFSGSSNREVALTRAVVGAAAGTLTAIATADPLGAVGVIAVTADNLACAALDSESFVVPRLKSASASEVYRRLNS